MHHVPKKEREEQVQQVARMLGKEIKRNNYDYNC